jgi:hypothetical protein
MPFLRHIAQSHTVSGGQNFSNALRHAAGGLAVCLADDDSLIPEPLVAHARRMERETDLTAIYTDWIAYDDARGQELHRYYHFSESACFDSDAPVALLDFLLRQFVLPEVGVFRRTALLQAQYLVARGTYAHFHLMYQLSRLGRIAFDLLPFYREHRVLKPGLPSRSSANMETRLHYIGDEFRNHLETIALWAFQDARVVALSDQQKATIRTLIDRYLESRIPLEINRCIQDRNWLLAADLRRRVVLWHGPGSAEDQRRDVVSIVVPAALQAVHAVYTGLTDVSGLHLSGFRTTQIHDFLRRHYPDIRLLTTDACSQDSTGVRPLTLFRDSRPATELHASEFCNGHVLWLDQLADKYRIHKASLDLSDL